MFLYFFAPGPLNVQMKVRNCPLSSMTTIIFILQLSSVVMAKQ